ncbi:transcription accessory protein [Rothia aeria]|uniref:Transcription accessory protein n=1 Tax=Rothia aeria TaxID=172042 RepID=A0A2Z5R319_9MICC|nr:transcription accessory protein [Rothia aeria]
MSAQRPHPKPANSSNRDGDAAPRPAPHNPAGGQGTTPAPAPGNRSHPHSPQPRNGTPNTSGAGEEAESIAAELHLAPANVNAVIALLDSGASVPFIARYRKEATSGMSDTNLRALHTRLTQLRALNQRREAIRTALTERYTEGLSTRSPTSSCSLGFAHPAPKPSWKTSTPPTAVSASPKPSRHAPPGWTRSLKTCWRCPSPVCTILPLPT